MRGGFLAMRTIHGTAALLGVLALATTASVACRSLPDCGNGSELDGLMCLTAASSSGSGSGSGSGAGGGGDASVPPNCIPNQNKDPVPDECGVFVSSSKGAAGQAGTKDQPLKTLAEAVGVAADSGRPIYMCAEEFIEDAGVDVPSGVTIYGGLDCNTAWGYVGASTKTRLTALADVIPLRLKFGAKATRLEDMHVLAPSAELMSGSSVAVLVDGGSASFVRSLLEAGDTRPGMSVDPFQTAAASGMDGSNGAGACTAPQVTGGIGPVNSCGNPDSVGGDGGNGTVNSGLPGAPGLPNKVANGGAGEGATACKPGTAGAAGVNGADGVDGMGVGTISPAGYVGAAGTNGVAGTVGQGGGGGGGSKGNSTCNIGADDGGASGGSGGSGGCGGGAGQGGGYGGSSIALISLNATLSFEATQLIAKAGREGGSGGIGQDGGKGGAGGIGGAGNVVVNIKAGCNGGLGGDGGKGGDGGDGAGGHSLGIAYKGMAPPMEGVTVNVDTAGPGAGDASDGVTQAMLEFP
jgi:hypothetical protein